MSYIFYDGDGIGEKFKNAYLASDIDRVLELSAALDNIHAEIMVCAHGQNGELIESGGDEGLIEVDAIEADLLSEVIREVWRSFDLECTVGIGLTPREAYLDCQQKKASR